VGRATEVTYAVPLVRLARLPSRFCSLV